MSTATPPGTSGALAGVRILDLTRYIPGPYGTMMLADLGADVVKVEPVEGDPIRAFPPAIGDESAAHAALNRGKRSISVDIRKPEGAEVVRRLAATADVLVESFRPGVLARRGLGPAEMLASHPRLVYCSVTGYGQDGPYAGRAGHDLGYGALGGFLGGNLGDDGRPVVPVTQVVDMTAGLLAVVGVLAALQARERTGRGQIVDSSLYEAVLQVMESLIPEYQVSGYIRERSGSKLPGIAPSNVYRCSDGDYLIGANQDAVFARLCTAMGRPELATDPRYADHVSRGRNQDELDAIVEDWTQTKSIAEVEALMIANSIPAGKIYRAPEMMDDPHFAAREALIDVDTARWGKVRMQNAFPKLSETPSSVRSPAPARIGEHNDEVYRELLGLSEADLADLTASGVI